MYKLLIILNIISTYKYYNMEIATTSNTNITLLFIYKIWTIILFYKSYLERKTAYTKYCII